MALGLFLMVSVLFSVRQQADDVLLRRALNVELDLSDLLSALLDAEVGQRGYLLTGDKAFLAPYRTASDRLDRELGRLITAVQGDADQVAAIAAIGVLMDRKRAELARTLVLHDRGDMTGAMLLVRGGTGMVLMDNIRHLVDRMDAEQDRLVASRQATVRTVGLVTSVSTGITLVLMGLVALAALSEARKRARLARFLPAEVASRLAEDDHGLRSGRSGPATVAFVDIRGSTALAETLTPAQLSRLLTGFRRAVSASARRHDGMVDKFIGDGALVVFGALDGDERAAAQGLDFARDLLQQLLPTAGSEPPFRIGIGLHHGDVVCGIVGDDDRQEFTVLGDTVNVASRIEEATKIFATELLVSEAVLRQARADLGAWRQVSCEPLRGRHEPTPLYVQLTDTQPSRGPGASSGIPALQLHETSR